MTPEAILLSESQVYFILQRLVEVGLYYKQKDQFHGDFNPGNISKTLFVYIFKTTQKSDSKKPLYNILNT